MKHQIVLIFILTLLMFESSAQQANRFILNGLISKRDTGMLFLQYRIHGNKVIDSAKIIDGKFVFTGVIDEPVKADLIDNQTMMHDGYKNYYSNFYIEPGTMSIYLVNDHFAAATITGSKTNTAYQTFNSGVNPILYRIDQLRRETDSLRTKLLSDSLSFYNIQAQIYLSAFIKNHPASFVVIQAIQWLYSFGGISADSAIALLHTIDNDLQKSYSASKAIQDFENIVNSSVGHPASDFIRRDTNGKKVALSSLKGKYVLLDFWASWCAPCREITPHVRDLYKKYHSKGLEVIAISCDSKYEDWYKAIKKDSMENFIHVLSFTDEDMNFLKSNTKVTEASFKGELRRMYNLMPIPVEILIDKDGIILGRYGGGEQPTHMLDKDLKEIFDKL